jgi:DNA-binding PadR family transcriptional regulator
VTKDPAQFLPVKDFVFRILVTLADGERHGWALVQALESSSGTTTVLPGHLYRTLDRMLDDGLIRERRQPASAPPPRTTRGAAPKRFFQLTELGQSVARAETQRLAALVAKSRGARLLKERR